MRTIIAILLGAATMAVAAENNVAAKGYDSGIKSVEGEVVSLAKAMPADKYNFAPKGGAFEGVRTFAEQVKHLAAVNYLVAAAALGEKPPVDTNGEKGPDSATTRDGIVAFLEGSFAYAHKAAQSATPANEWEEIKSPFGNGKTTRAAMLNVVMWHSFDHYGQMVVYARMNGVVPPASR
jgi:uncharacterized damage-inducible protein DinB